MANGFIWVIAGLYYKVKPSINTYPEFKFYYLKFCLARNKKVESTYFINFERELLGDLELNKCVNVFLNIDIQILDILRNHHSRNSMVNLFKNDKITKSDIDDFLSETIDHTFKENSPSKKILI